MHHLQKGMRRVELLLRAVVNASGHCVVANKKMQRSFATAHSPEMTPNSGISSALDAFAKAWEATSAGLLLATALLVCMVALLAFVAASATVLHINDDADAWRKGRVFGASILAGELAVIVFLGVKSGQSAGTLSFEFDEIVPAALMLAGVAFIYPIMGIAANKVSEQLQKFAVPGLQAPWSRQVLLSLLPFWPFVLAYWVVMTPLLAIIDRVGGEAD